MDADGNQEKKLTYINTCVSQFPEEIFSSLVKFLSVNDLLNFRSVNSTWNQLVCRLLCRNEQFSVSFKNEESPTSFVATMFNCIQTQPFGTFKFQGHHPNTFILDAIGPSILICVLEINQAPPLSFSSLLKAMPNLEKLKILGAWLNVNWVSIDFPKLSRIRSLVLHRACDQAKREDVPLDTIKNWISLMPKLSEFETGFTILINSAPGFLQFLHWVCHVSIKAKVKFLEVPVQLDDSGITKTGIKLFVANKSSDLMKNTNVATWINIFAPCFKMLDLRIGGNGTDISKVFTNLDTLRLHLTHSVDERFKPEYFPSLRKVVIKFRGGNVPQNGTYFGGTVFPTVDSFYVRAGFSMSGEPLEPWDEIFPNVKNFRVEGIVLQCHFDLFATFYKDLFQLNITSHDTSDYSFDAYSRTEIWESVISNPELEVAELLENARLMSKLKRLELFGYDEKILMNLVILSQCKAMASLDFLGIYGYHPTVNLQSPLKKLMSKINRHTEIKFEPTYDGRFWEE